MRGLQGLPEELLLRIFSTVDAANLNPLQSVCRSFYVTISSNFTRLRKLKLSREVWIHWEGNEIGFFPAPRRDAEAEQLSIAFHLRDADEIAKMKLKATRKSVERMFTTTSEAGVVVEGHTIWSRTSKRRSYEVSSSGSVVEALEALVELIQRRLSIAKVLIDIDKTAYLDYLGSKFDFPRVFIGGNHDLKKSFLQEVRPKMLSLHLHEGDLAQEFREDFFALPAVQKLRTLEFHVGMLAFLLEKEIFKFFRPSTLRYCYVTREVVQASLRLWHDGEMELKAWTVFLVERETPYEGWRGVQEGALKDIARGLRNVEYYTPSFEERNPITGEWERFQTDFSCMRIRRPGGGLVLEARCEYSRSADGHLRCETPCGPFKSLKRPGLAELENRNLLPVVRLELFVPLFRYRDFVEEP